MSGKNIMLDSLKLSVRFCEIFTENLVSLLQSKDNLIKFGHLFSVQFHVGSYVSVISRLLYMCFSLF